MTLGVGAITGGAAYFLGASRTQALLAGAGGAVAKHLYDSHHAAVMETQPKGIALPDNTPIPQFIPRPVDIGEPHPLSEMPLGLPAPSHGFFTGLPIGIRERMRMS